MNSKINIIGFLFVLFIVGSCGDQYDYEAPLTPVKGSAKFKLIHAAPDTTGIVVKIDNNIVSGVNTVLTATVTKPGLTTYGSIFPLSEYFTVSPGSKKVSVGFVSATDPNVSADLSRDFSFAADKFYSGYLVGQKPNYSIVIGEDDLSAFSPIKTHIRFVNTITNTPAAGLEFLVNNVVVATSTATTLGSDPFIEFDQDRSNRFTIVIRQKGTTTALATLSNQNLVRGKKYTIIARGISGNTTTALRPSMSLFSNN